MKKMKDSNCFQHTSIKAGHQLSGQIRSFIHAIYFICLFILYPFACYGMFLVLKGLHLCDINKLINNGLIPYENMEMLFQGLTNILLLLILLPFIMLLINHLWKCTVKNIKKELEEENLNKEQG